ncbi:MAG: hypothetical protein CL521_03415 [Actinobacteria bacterium]|nr:hypothetical protein [Actinomycetota bacterium]
MSENRTTQNQAKPAQIVIVEDNMIMATDIKRRVTQLGYQVIETFSNGEDCIQSLTQLKPDLILMDIEIEVIWMELRLPTKFVLLIIFLLSF